MKVCAVHWSHDTKSLRTACGRRWCILTRNKKPRYVRAAYRVVLDMAVVKEQVTCKACRRSS